MTGEALELTSSARIIYSAPSLANLAQVVSREIEELTGLRLKMATVTLLQAIIETNGIYGSWKMKVNDAPDAEYRGLMVDVARNYHSIATLKERVDMCRLYKVRFLQIHLTDDQASTFPSTAYPKLSVHRLGQFAEGTLSQAERTGAGKTASVGSPSARRL